jgi:hypothetical protein
VELEAARQRALAKLTDAELVQLIEAAKLKEEEHRSNRNVLERAIDGTLVFNPTGRVA